MRVLVLSDIHANAFALQSALAKESVRAVDGIWFLGDLVGYGPEPEKVVEWFLRGVEEGSIQRWVPGNHDIALIESAARLDMAKHARQSVEHHRHWLFKSELYAPFAEHLQSLSGYYLPRTSSSPFSTPWSGVPRWQTPNTLWLLSHGALSPLEGRVNWYLYPWRYELCLHARELESYRRQQGLQRVVLWLGHTHFPMLVHARDSMIRLHPLPYEVFIGLDEGTWIVNPGSVGMPRDGDVRAAFAVADLDQGQIAFVRLSYDVDETVQRLWDRFPPDLAEVMERRLAWEGVRGDAKAEVYREFYQPFTRAGMEGLEVKTQPRCPVEVELQERTK